MRLPVRRVNRPAVLTGRANGRLPVRILRRTPGLDGTPDVVLVEPAAEAWQALCYAAADAGHRFTISHPDNAYRPYGKQEMIFLARYYPSILGTRWWNGKRWRKRPGVAAAAVPGTSNHGWGLAVDIRNMHGAQLQWMVDHGHTYGFSAEIVSEPWHWRYFAGDNPPAAVLEHHRRTEEDSMILLHDTDSNTWRVAVPGEGSAVITEPGHWYEVITEGRKTGVYKSPYVSDLLAKIRAERR